MKILTLFSCCYLLQNHVWARLFASALSLCIFKIGQLIPRPEYWYDVFTIRKLHGCLNQILFYCYCFMHVGRQGHSLSCANPCCSSIKPPPLVLISLCFTLLHPSSSADSLLNSVSPPESQHPCSWSTDPRRWMPGPAAAGQWQGSVSQQREEGEEHSRKWVNSF